MVADGGARYLVMGCEREEQPYYKTWSHIGAQFSLYAAWFQLPERRYSPQQPCLQIGAGGEDGTLRGLFFIAACRGVPG